MTVTLSDMLGARATTVEPLDKAVRDRRVSVPWSPSVLDVQPVLGHVRKPKPPPVSSAPPAEPPEPPPPTLEELVAAGVAAELDLRLAAALAAERQVAEEAHGAAMAEAVEATRAEAFAAGLEEGRALGRADREPELTAYQEQLASAVDGFAGAAMQLTAASRKEAAELGFELARAVVGASLELSPAALAVVIERAFDAVPHGPVATVLCHADDVEVVSAQVARHPGLGERRVTAEVGGTVRRGGCRIVLGHGTVEANGHALVESLIRAVRARLEEPEEDEP